MSLRAHYLHKLFGIPMHRRFIFTPICIYLFSHLFTPVWTQVYLLRTLGYNPIVLYLLCHADCSISSCWSSLNWLLCPFDILYCCVFLKALPNFLALEDALGSSCMFPDQVLESAISPRSPGSLY